MGKLLLLLLLVLAGVWLVKRALRNAARQEHGNPATSKASEELVRCAHCGLLLPRGEARQAGGAIYCSEEHSRLGPGR
ncbi:MAG TPA: PP0621 family protein [Burkholderiales bacterium]|nr:PP0621 family protein [Burkholderiales bacterium]